MGMGLSMSRAVNNDANRKARLSGSFLSSAAVQVFLEMLMLAPYGLRNFWGFVEKRLWAA
jgi:hypothetical protein